MANKAKKPPHIMRRLIEASGTAAILGLIIASLGASGVIGMTTAWIELFVAWIFSVTFAVYEPFLSVPKKTRTIVKCVCVAAITIIMLALGIYEGNNQPTSLLEKSRLYVQKIEFQPPINGESNVAIVILDNGTLSAKHITVWPRFITATPPQETIDSGYIAAALNKLSRDTQRNKDDGFEIEPNAGPYAANFRFKMTQPQYDSIRGGKLAILTVVLLVYDDENNIGQGGRVTEFCAYYNHGFSDPLICPDYNRVYDAAEKISYLEYLFYKFFPFLLPKHLQVINSNSL
jgi:hypothetical protein